MTEINYDAAIAVVGMSGRFPAAANVAEFWENLLANKPGLRVLTDEELLSAGVSPAQLANPAYVRVTGSLDDYEIFDAGIFGFNRREAEAMEPQHRMLLEVCWEALEDAGYAPTQIADRVGIFAGCGYPDYAWNIFGKMSVEPGGQLMMAIGTERDSLASLVSYKLDLRGPSVTVQSFCSTSLVAVHLAAQSLLNFECEMALAGGAFIPLPQGAGYMFEEGGIYAPDGVVRAFDAAARGSVAGSGVSVVTLRRLADAIADGDHIEAVILGSAVNNDGRACAGYTAPGVDGQADVMTQAISFAGVEPETVGYVECHGTGTMLGDSIELAALAKAFPKVPERPTVLGSLKPSIGHLDRASGTTGLIRAALALRNKVLPGTLNYQTPNPALATARDRFRVLTEHQPWPESSHPRRAGVSSFGLGGTNAHVVLEEPPDVPRTDRPGPHLLVLSARDEAALDQATDNLRRHLDSHPHVPIADVAFTLQQSRSQLSVRRSVVCDDLLDARLALSDSARWATGEARHRDPALRLEVPEPAAVPDQWWQDLSIAVERITQADLPQESTDPPLAALRAVCRGLVRLGMRIGQVSGPDEAAHLVDDLAKEFATEVAECQAEVRVAPVDGQSAERWLLAAIGTAWRAGAAVTWRRLHRGEPRRLSLPTYPFQRRRYWVDRPANPLMIPDMPVEGRVDDLDRWTYIPGWRHAPLELVDRTEQIREAGPWLVFAAEDIGEQVAAYLRTAGAAVTTVRPGREFALDGDDMTVCPDSVQDMNALLGALQAFPRTVVHAFALAGGAADADTAVQPDADGDPTLGFESVVSLTVALARHAFDETVDLVAVTDRAVSIAGTAPRQPNHAGLYGLVPVMAQENPGWTCRMVDVDREAAAVSTPTFAAAIVTEALADHAGPVVLRGVAAGRWLREYKQVPLPPAPDELLPEGSTVLITGGLGYVGLILARHLALHRKCNVVLTSRSGVPPREQWEDLAAAGAQPPSRAVRSVRALLELERKGAGVLALAADVSDEQSMRAAVEAARDRFKAIDLVVHAAGVSDEAAFGPAHMIDRDAGRTHFAAKVDGFRTLMRVLTDQPVRGITLSSLSAVLGGLALGPYAASNAALDAHVLASRANGHGLWITVDWDTWRPDPDAPEDLTHARVIDMSPEEGAEIFGRALAAIEHVDHLVISTGPLDGRYEQWIVAQGRQGLDDDDDEGERDPRPDLPTPYVEPAEGTESVLAGVWARVLRLEKVGADDDFFRLGGNSVLAIELVARLRRELKVPVPTTALMGYPTVRGLASQIGDVVEAVDHPAGQAAR
jgi:acyl transferase domain-containing protein/acyl carrier protein